MKTYYVVNHYSELNTYRTNSRSKRELHSLQPQQLLSTNVAKSEFNHLIGDKLVKIKLERQDISNIGGFKFVR